MLYVTVKRLNTEFSSQEKHFSLVFSFCIYMIWWMSTTPTPVIISWCMKVKLSLLLYTFNLYKMTKNVDSQALWLWRLNDSEIGQHPEADVVCLCVCEIYFLKFERLEQVFMFSQKSQ